ncbi:BTAD domain-containing putative transcriptional regulator [Nocardioides sp. SR21]|uniref:ATP-binding protein n=1 Tax=Nocardioides sp. SR21 TaxID=2919501 RepID=UPI001FAAE21F|nr:BTAD domain-containing putative transcriptional regulator [Nocardioides sp. SR21]
MQVTIQVLGPLRVWRDGVEIDLGPRQRTYLLALLLFRAGRPVSTSELIDLIWDDEMPTSALNILQKYVGALRRLLEPELPARASGSFLHRRGSGYLFEPTGVELDLAEFRTLRDRAREELAADRVEDALASYERALAAWHGPAGDGLALTARALPLVASINEELLDACVEAARLAVPHGHAKRVHQPLRLAGWMAPYDETVQATLMTALAASGQQVEALSVFETVRLRLAEDLGIDPGPALREAHEQVLRQVGPTSTPRPAGVHPLVGRREELALVRNAVDSAAFAGSQLVVVEGPPGVGKTRLLVEVSAEALRQGALPAWGGCQHGDGAPAMWPWIQVVGSLLASLPAERRSSWSAGVLGDLTDRPDLTGPAPARLDVGARFQLFEQVTALLAEVATDRPVLVVVDDLHWADLASLQLFTHLAGALPAGCVLMGTVRDHAPAPSDEVRSMLAALARLDRHRRISLGPLDPAEVAELIRRDTGQVPSPGVALSIQARAEGNPLFVRELARYLADIGGLDDQAAARAGVPSTVRDIVEDRTHRLDDDLRRLIGIAALMGRDIDVRLLAHAAEIEAAACLESLGALEALGLVEVAPGSYSEWRFTHDLVREAVARSTPQAEAAHLHLRVADALERAAGSADRHAEALGHHLVLAGPLAEPARVAEALLIGGRVATRRCAYDLAEKYLDACTRAARDAGLPELELTALTERLAVTGIHAGFVATTPADLDRAEELARSLGREREATEFLVSRFLAHAQAIQISEGGRIARRLLRHGERSTDPVVRAAGHHAWGVHQWSSGHVGEACRHLGLASRIIAGDHERDPMMQRLQLLTPVMLALNTALHGDLDAAHALFDAVEADAGDDPYRMSIWGSFSVTAAVAAGDPRWALRVAEATIATDPDFAFSFSGAYTRLARHWARAMTGGNAAAEADQVETIIAATLVDPPRSNLATWYALLAEMHLVAGDAPAAMAALDRAEAAIAVHGERYAEGLVLLMRARTLRDSAASPAEVRAAARHAVTISRSREAHLFATRATDLLGELALR